MTANDVVNYLKTLDKITDVRPVRVTITSPKGRKSQTWEGASYKQGEDPRTRFYLLGTLPKPQLRHPASCCFTYNGADWYVAGYWQSSKPEFAYRQPLGKTFLLFMWDERYGKIDQYERWTYKRFPMMVQWLD